MWIISIGYNGSGIQSMQDQNVSLEVELLMPNLAKGKYNISEGCWKTCNAQERNRTEQNRK